MSPLEPPSVGVLAGAKIFEGLGVGGSGKDRALARSDVARKIISSLRAVGRPN